MSDLPRLLLCSFDVIPGPSGSSRRLTEYLKALPDRFSVVVLSAKTPDHSHIEKYQGARLLRVPVGSGDLVSRIQTFERAVRRQLDSEEYALAHFTDPFGGYALCELKGDYGYRLIYEAQTFPSQELRYTHPQTEGDRRFLAKIRRQELFCLMNADLVITGSQTTRTYIQSLGASTEQIRVIRSPVDLGPYTPDVVGVPDGQPMRLLYLGSQAGWQGLPTLMRALALAVEQGAEVKLTLVGARHPDWQPHLEDLAKELGLQELVEFQPPVPHDDLAKVLALADVGVMPLDDVDRNRLQGGPLAKVSEYFAAGLPVLAADLPVTRELLPASAVLFHTAGDAKALAEHILELSRDVPRRLEMGREARAYADQEFDAGLIRGKLLDIYDELLGKRSVVGAPSELPAPTMTGTPTNRVSALKPPEGGAKPEGGGKRPRGKASGSEKGKGAGKKSPPKDDLPLVLGQVLEDGMDTRLIKTEPDVVRSNEPPVVMGKPLRDKKPTGSSARRDSEVDEPPTSIITGVPLGPEEDTRTPTPIVRPLEPSAAEPPLAAASRPSSPPLGEAPPTPTPIVPMKPPGGTAANGSSRVEPGASRAPMAPSSKTGSRSALQEPSEVPSSKTGSRSALQEPSDQKGRPTTLPPVVRPPPSSETRGPPPRLEPVAPSGAQAAPPAEAAAHPAPKIPPPPEPTSLPTPRVPPPPEPSSLPGARASAPQETAAPPTPKVPPPPEPTSLPTPRVPPPPEPSSLPGARSSVPQETAAPPMPKVPPPPEPSSLPTPRVPPPPEPSSLPGARTSSQQETAAPPVLRIPPPPEPTLLPGARSTAPQETATPPRLPPTLPPLKPSGSIPTPTPLVARKVEEEPEELPEEEAQEISEETDLGAEPTPPHPRAKIEEPEELSNDEVEEASADDLEEADADAAVEAPDDDLEEADADAVEATDDDLEEADADAVEATDDDLEEADADEAVESPARPEENEPPKKNWSVTPAPLPTPMETPVAEPPSSALDPWFAQVAHGYCPPEGAQFARHTPPTNFPGRDEEPTDPSRVPPTPKLQGASSRGKS